MTRCHFSGNADVDAVQMQYADSCGGLHMNQHTACVSSCARRQAARRRGAAVQLYARNACGVLDVSFSLSLRVVEFPVHGKFRSLSSLSLGTLELSIERPPFQARVAYGLTLAATLACGP